MNKLNKSQLEAVLSNEKYLLILAGAGTGKTHTITSKIIHLIKNEHVFSNKILALTFTNKACDEMEKRVKHQVGDYMKFYTFHSYGAYFLRKFSNEVNRTKYFIIYDDDDSYKTLQTILVKKEVQKVLHKKLFSSIKRYKQNLENITLIDLPEELHELFLEIYNEYNKHLEMNNSFDFEDLILHPVKILQKSLSFKKIINYSFDYIIIDEFQDTNLSQYQFIRELANEKTKIVVVGDEDQSIYKFRGSDINIILNFSKDFENVKMIKLEENYRSTENILNIANYVIKNNSNRIGKNLYSTKGIGEDVILNEFVSDEEEAKFVANEINKKNLNYKDTAILVRTNYQINVIESYLRNNRTPYIVIGNISFFEREEIKDCLAIIRFIINNCDKISFLRFCNKPTKGLGEKTIEKFFSVVDSKFNGNILNALKDHDNLKQYNFSSKVLHSLTLLSETFENIEKIIEENSISKILKIIITNLNIDRYYYDIVNDDEEEESLKINNIWSFIEMLEDVPIGKDGIISYLERNSLVSQVDSLDLDNDKVKLLTIHNSKGLEFENVFIVGVENTIFPSERTVLEFEDGLDEERRLFYVAITRAKRRLYISYSLRRRYFNQIIYSGKSCFIDELPDYLKSEKKTSNIKVNSIFKINDIVKSKNFGKGKVVELQKIDKYDIVIVDFFDYGIQNIILQYENLEIIDD